MRRLRTALRFVLALALTTFAACGDRETTSPATAFGIEEPFFITGTVTAVGQPWGYRVQGRPGTSYPVTDAFFTVGPSTVIQKSDRSAASTADLTVGRGITLWITGAIAESLPVQVGARLIVVK